MDYILAKSEKEIIGYGGLSLASKVTSDEGKSYIYILEEVDEYGTCLMSEIDEDLFMEYIEGRLDLLGLIRKSYKWYLCESNGLKYNIIHEYESFRSVPSDYLPDHGIYNDEI